MEEKMNSNSARSVENNKSRAYAGLLGESGCRVLALNGRTADVGQRTEQPSGAFVTINTDGSWIYEPPTAITELASDQKAIDGFRCDVDTDGRITQETISIVLRNPAASGRMMTESQRPENPLETSATDPVRLLVKASTYAESRIDLRIVSGHTEEETPAVLVLEQPTGGTAVVSEATGCVIFSPTGGFAGIAEIRCLVESRNRSATFVIIHVDVRPPIQIHTSTLGNPDGRTHCKG